MRQAERESWGALHNMSVVDTPETLAAARTLAVNSGITDALGRAGITIPDEFLDDLTCHIMSGACVPCIMPVPICSCMCLGQGPLYTHTSTDTSVQSSACRGENCVPWIM